MDPDKIVLDNLNKNFEYAKISREIDACNDVEQLRNISKCYVKLYFKTQETIVDLVK